MSRSRFFRFAERIINMDRIVAAAPPTLSAHGYELTIRMDGQLSFTEDFANQSEADARWAEVEHLLLGNGSVIELADRKIPTSAT